jgi:predicted esterase
MKEEEFTLWDAVGKNISRLQKPIWRVYTRNVSEVFTFYVLAVCLGLAADLNLGHALRAEDRPYTRGVSQQTAAESRAAPQPGVVISHQVCAAHADQSYALYLPSGYTPDKKWPIVYAFDPAARGRLPVDAMKVAAERYGYIVAGSNNSHNGAWKAQGEAVQALLEDTHALLSLDEHRVYFAGFSGGARLASSVAQRCKCAAGVVLNGAGFPVGAAPSRDSVFAVFSAVGNLDFNYPEVTRLNDTLETAGFPHFLRYFEGVHEWAPALVMDEALAWFQLVAMKQKIAPRDDEFVAQRQAAALSRAQGFERSGDSYAAWREYRQSAATLDGLASDAGVASLRQGATALASQKGVREGAKREKQDFEEQNQLTGEISAGLEAMRQVSTNLTSTFGATSQKIIELRERSAHENHMEKLVVYRRAIAGVTVEAMEAGSDRLEAKDVTLAKDYFQLAVEADPESAWALQSLAVARAMGNDRKGTLEVLRQAKERTKDMIGFLAWVREEPSFAKFREDPQFRALLTDVD